MSLKRKRLRERRTVLLPREIVLPPDDYEPTKAELEEESEMPGADMGTVRRAFFRPTKIVRRSSKK